MKFHEKDRRLPEGSGTLIGIIAGAITWAIIIRIAYIAFN